MIAIALRNGAVTGVRNGVTAGVTGRIEALEAENQALRDRIEELEDALGLPSIARPAAFRAPEWHAFCVLAKRGFLNRETAIIALYGDRYVDDRPDPKIIDVFMCRIRAALRPYGIPVRTIWGKGWSLDPDAREKAQALIERVRTGEALECITPAVTGVTPAVTEP